MVCRSEAPGEQLPQEAPDNQEDADDHMQTVESSDQKEAGSVNATGIEPEALIMHVPPLVALDTNKEGAEGDRNKKPAQAGFAFHDRAFCQMERNAAREKKDRIHGGKKDWEGRKIGNRGPGMACLPREAIFGPAQDKVSSEEACKEHGFGDEEHDHTKFGDGRGGACVTMGVVCYGC